MYICIMKLYSRSPPSSIHPSNGDKIWLDLKMEIGIKSAMLEITLYVQIIFKLYCLRTFKVLYCIAFTMNVMHYRLCI